MFVRQAHEDEKKGQEKVPKTKVVTLQEEAKLLDFEELFDTDYPPSYDELLEWDEK